MSLKNINPTKTSSWKNLESHYEQIRDVEMKSLFQNDSNRKNKFNLSIAVNASYICKGRLFLQITFINR